MRPNPKQLVEFFSRSLASFCSSPDAFRVLCTLPRCAGSQEPASRPSSRLQRLVVLDSSFNPPTRAHAKMAKSALEWAFLSSSASSSSSSVSSSISSEAGAAPARLMLLLAVNNADKAPKPASFPVRLGMMEAFGHDLPGTLQGDIKPEIDLAVTKMPYFHDKARAIAESGFYSSSGNQEPEQIFLAGFDTVIRIFNPKYYSTGGGMRAALGPFFERARLRVTMRTDDEWGGEAEQEDYVRGLGEGKLEEVGGDMAWAGRVDLVEGRGDAVSSSKVREMVKGGERGGLGSLVDDEVLGWIEEEGLYKE
ncbi:Nucleotidylyl transferase [Trichoderma ceciliae]